jgi:DNA-binding transcriptional regulator YhcF (GntR family)
VIISVDLDSVLPPYEQIRAQVTAMAASGVLPTGTRLPTIRQLSRDLGVAAGTVGRAYRELEAAGVITTRGRHGTYLAQPPTLPAHERATRLQLAAANYLQTARQLGAGPAETILALEQAMATPQPARKSSATEPDPSLPHT